MLEPQTLSYRPDASLDGPFLGVKVNMICFGSTKKRSRPQRGRHLMMVAGTGFVPDERTQSIFMSHWIYRVVFHGVKTLIRLDAEPSSS